MKPRLADLLACPECSGSLQIDIQHRDNDEILTGLLGCPKCRCHFPIRDGIPRFVASDAYASSFSFEWKRWQRTQFDTDSRKLSESTFVVSTGTRPQELAAKHARGVALLSDRSPPTGLRKVAADPPA